MGGLVLKPKANLASGGYHDLNSNFEQLVSAGLLPDIRDVQGVELYYNAAIAPWLR
jgi:hypothetical protein